MNCEFINKLLESNDITKYIEDLFENFYNTYIHNSLHRINFILNKNNTIKIIDLELTIVVDNITDFLKRINNIKYNLEIESYPEFQYIKSIVTRLETILIKLLALDKKTKTLLIIAIESNNKEIAETYNNFLDNLRCYITNYDLSLYPNLDYKILSYIVQLNEETQYAKSMFNFLKGCFKSYLIYHSFDTDDMFIDKFENDVFELLKSHTIELKRYWTNYIDATIEPIYLQSIIQDAETIDIKITQNSIFFILSLLILSYEDSINRKLLIVVDYSKIHVFLSTLLEHIIIYL